MPQLENKDKTDLITRAKTVLRRNWQNGFTIPRHQLYPFQWNWDSGFIMLGQQHYDLDMAMQELRSLLTGQWQNGMIPHIVFHSEREDTYFPNWDFWESSVNPGSPETPKTSGITQPPVFGFVLRRLWDQHHSNEVFVDFCREVIPQLIKAQQFFYTHRDPQDEGLLHIIHPWESGRDNSPLWDDALRRIQYDRDSLPDYQRKDTTIAAAEERPTTADYDCYVYLLEYAKRHQYEDKALAHEAPFRVQDTMMNALLIRSNRDLLYLCDQLNLRTDGLEDLHQKSLVNYHRKFWRKDIGWHCCFDLNDNEHILHREIGGITSLFAGVATRESADRYQQHLQDLHQKGYYLCPSFDVDSSLFDSRRYWRGPIWPQMNWLVAQGLEEYGYNEVGQQVRDDLIELVASLGFYEYFEAQKHIANTLTHGYGGDQFSWTASCLLDLIHIP